MADKVTPWEDYDYSPKLPDFYQVIGGIMGLSACMINNAYRRLPIFYKPMVNIPLYLALGIGVGTGAQYLRNNYMDRKIRLAEAYIQAHPEEFVEAPRKTYGDILMQWTPRR